MSQPKLEPNGNATTVWMQPVAEALASVDCPLRRQTPL